MSAIQRIASGFTRAHPIVQLVALILGIQILAYGGVLAAEVVPDAAIADNLVAATLSGDLQPQDYKQTPGGHQIDGYTECIALTEGLGDPIGSTPFETAATSNTLGQCSSAVPKLTAYASTGGFEKPSSYFRYWHGYTVITRPALALFGVGSTRALCLYLMFAGLGGLWWMARARFGAWVASALTLPMVLTADVLELHASVPQAIAWACAFFCAMLTMFVLDPLNQKPRATPANTALVGVLCGSLVAYFDLMVAMTANLCFVLTLTLLIGLKQAGGDAKWRRIIPLILSAGTGWLIGTAVTWTSKWLVAAAFVGADNVAKNIKHQVGFRINGESAYAAGGFGSALRANLTVWTESRLVQLLLAATVAALGYLVVRSWRQGTLRPRPLIMFGFVAMCVPVWFEVLSNHSQIHSWFTFRSLAVGLSTGIVGVIQATRRDVVVWNTGPESATVVAPASSEEGEIDAPDLASTNGDRS